MDEPVEPGQDESLAKNTDKEIDTEAGKADQPTKEVDQSHEAPKEEASPPEPASPGPVVPDQILASGLSLPTDQAVAVANSNMPANDAAPAKPKKALLKDRLKNLGRKKLILIGLGLVLILIFAVPFSRYKLLGIFIQQTVTVTVIDSATAAPVSQARVAYDGRLLLTNDEGKAKISAAIGSHKLTITKQYYERFSESYFLGFGSKSHSLRDKLVATGRLVPINVTNTITSSPIAGALISVNATSAKTNSSGLAELALPASSKTLKGTISLSGYNSKNVVLQITNQTVKANDFQLTPSGQVYFLSNASGTIDVVKTNLDGSGRTTVYAGTGKEDPNNTYLLATSDWHYLVLESSRSGTPALYLINTANDNVTEFEQSGDQIDIIGWAGHDFIYDLVNSNDPYSQSGREVIKSYDADTQQTDQLDQNTANGNANAYAYQQFGNFNIVGQQLVYTTQWLTYDSGGSYDTTGLNDTIRGISSTGQGKKDYQTFPLSSVGYLQAAAYSPTSVYFAVFDSTDGSATYFNYSNMAVSTSSISSTTFSADYPNYYTSPNAKQTFWSELVDGQDNLYAGDDSGNNKKQIASFNGYTPYGWYGNNYVLVTNDGSQLYILSSNGLKANQRPYKITDYYKSPSANGGYGYGGI